ncbi:hypothetical protein [Kineococcus sp. SYSU DK001]|uniref:hypothetical protein n=1 Tax=Kineococcus sp. SYSU DK001 TaxID=3383122 RepID=UPI003D7E28A1
MLINMLSREEHLQRWRSTGRTALAGAALGSAGGAVTGALALLGDEVWGPAEALTVGVIDGAPFGAVLGAAFGVVSGALGGCLAMHVVRRHSLLARMLLALCCAVLIATAAAWSLPEPTRTVGTLLAAAAAAAVSWVSAPWCFRPLRDAVNPAS